MVSELIKGQTGSPHKCISESVSLPGVLCKRVNENWYVDVLAAISPPTSDTWLSCRKVIEADVWLCYDSGNKMDMWLYRIQRSRCGHCRAITICSDEFGDSAMLDVRWLSFPQIKETNKKHKTQETK